MDILHTRLFTTPIAHRGLHNEEIPENSLKAYENAIEHGFPIEIDVRTIDDGTVVVFHDDALGRMTGKDGYVSNLQASELNDAHLKGTDQTIPTFEQVLSLVNGQVPLLIETKVTAKVGPLESKVAEMLKNYKGEFALQSFDPYSMAYFYEHEPDMLRGQLSALNCGLSYFKRKALGHLKVNKISHPHFVSYCFSDLPNKYVTKAKLPTLAWTLTSRSDCEKVQDCCDNIIFERFLPEKE